MSKQNKVNPGQYHVGGRLTPDEMARERMKQRHVNRTRESDPPKVMKAGASARTTRPAASPATRSAAADRARRLQPENQKERA
jgi:hypothetical protein